MKKRLFHIFLPTFQSALVIAQGFLVNKLSDRLDQELSIFLIILLALASGMLIALLDASFSFKENSKITNRSSINLFRTLLGFGIPILLTLGIANFLLIVLRSTNINTTINFPTIIFRSIPIILFLISFLVPPIALILLQIAQYQQTKYTDRIDSEANSKEFSLFQEFITFTHIAFEWTHQELLPSIIKNRKQIILRTIAASLFVCIIFLSNVHYYHQSNVNSLVRGCSESESLFKYYLERKNAKPSAIQKAYGLELERLCSKLIKSPPKKSDLNLYYFNRANARYTSGNLQGAIEDYSQSIAKRADFFKAYENRGIVRLKLNDIKGSIEDYSQANIITHGRILEIKYHLLAKIHTELGELKTAIRIYTEKLKNQDIEPLTEKHFLNARGDLFYSLGEYRLAINDFYRATDLDDLDYSEYNYYVDIDRLTYRDYAIILKIMNSSVMLGKTDEPFKDYSLIIEKNSCISVEEKMEEMSAFIRQINAINDSREEQPEQLDNNESDLILDDYEYEREFRRFLDKNPEDLLNLCSDAYYARGGIREIKWDHYGGIGDYTRAIQLRPDFAQAYYQRGDIYLRMKHQDVAIQDYQKAADLFLKQGKKEDYQRLIKRIQTLKQESAQLQTISN